LGGALVDVDECVDEVQRGDRRLVAEGVDVAAGLPQERQEGERRLLPRRGGEAEAGPTILGQGLGRRPQLLPRRRWLQAGRLEASAS
jgi:hypothetical protein